MRWQSSGVVVAFNSASTTGRPRVRLGTKWASITSTCSQSAPAPGSPPTIRASSPRRAKSAASKLGAIIGGTPAGYAPGLRSKPRNIASVPWRCGHSCTRRALAEVRHAGQQRTGVELLHVAVLAQHGAQHAVGLGEVRRARDVGDHAAGAHVPQRGREELALELGQRRHVVGATAPAGFGPPSQRAEAGARGVHEHPVVGALGQRGLAAVGGVHVHRAGRRRRGARGRRGARWAPPRRACRRRWRAASRAAPTSRRGPRTGRASGRCPRRSAAPG